VSAWEGEWNGTAKNPLPFFGVMQGRYFKRIAQLAEDVRQSQADVIAFQEVRAGMRAGPGVMPADEWTESVRGSLAGAARRAAQQPGTAIGQ
jgi:hypothetical protein